MELAINNEIDRYSLAIDAIDRVPKLHEIGSHAKERFRNLQIHCRDYAYEQASHDQRSPDGSGYCSVAAFIDQEILAQPLVESILAVVDFLARPLYRQDSKSFLPLRARKDNRMGGTVSVRSFKLYGSLIF
jgi:XFP-like protein